MINPFKHVLIDVLYFNFIIVGLVLLIFMYSIQTGHFVYFYSDQYFHLWAILLSV